MGRCRHRHRIFLRYFDLLLIALTSFLPSDDLPPGHSKIAIDGHEIIRTERDSGSSGPGRAGSSFQIAGLVRRREFSRLGGDALRNDAL